MSRWISVQRNGVLRFAFVVMCWVDVIILIDSPLDALAPYASDSRNFYELRLGSVTWQGASVLSPLATYRGVMGHLITIQTVAEEAFVKWLAGSGEYWLGLTQNPLTQQWIYTAGPEVGQTAGYTDWYAGFSSGSNPNCTFMNANDNGQWFTTACSQYLPFVIEYECGTGYAFGVAGCIGLPLFTGI